jgi:hypothetical protein
LAGEGGRGKRISHIPISLLGREKPIFIDQPLLFAPRKSRGFPGPLMPPNVRPRGCQGLGCRRRLLVAVVKIAHDPAPTGIVCRGAIETTVIETAVRS